MQNINPYPLQIFVFGSDTRLGDQIVKKLGIKPAGWEMKRFPDGERLPHQIETVRGRDVFIIFTSLSGPNMDNWALDYLRFVRSIKCGHPNKITVILPKLLHQRQDVENLEQRETSMSDFYPDLLKTAGVDHIVVCKLHNPASRTKTPPMDNLSTTRLITKHIRKFFKENLSHLAIAAGDFGASKYARNIAIELGVPVILVDKDRNTRNGEAKSLQVLAYTDLEGIDTVVFVDDLISTFGSLKSGGDAVYTKFPNIVNYYAVATHPDFNKDTADNILTSRFSEVWVTDTVPVADEFIAQVAEHGKKISILSVVEKLVWSITNLHNNESLTQGAEE